MINKYVSIIFFCLISNTFSCNASDAKYQLGESIFVHGKGRAGRIIDTDSSVKNNTHSFVACAGCHGKDAKGGKESFIEIPDIRWRNLSNDYADRRQRQQAYNEELFARAIRKGVSADGRSLDPFMPRFQLADDEVEALIHYLSAMSLNEAPPVFLALVSSNPHNTFSKGLINKFNQCYQHSEQSMVLKVIEFDSPSDAIESLLMEEKSAEVWVIAPDLFGWENEYIAATTGKKIKTLFPGSLLSLSEINNWYFVFPGFEDQLYKLLTHVKNLSATHLIIHFEDDSVSRYLLQSAIEIARKLDLTIITSEGAKKENRDKIAELWLHAIDDNVLSDTKNPGKFQMSLAFYFREQKLPIISNKIIQIANNHISEHHQWVLPVDLWGDISCEFLRTWNPQKPKSQLKGLTLHSLNLPYFPAISTSTERRNLVGLKQTSSNE